MSILKLLHAIIVAKKAESLTSQQIHDLQHERFKKLLRHVLQNSRFYQRFYQDHGIRERDVDGVKPEDLPVIDKQMMMENYDDLVCNPSLKRDALERFITETPDAGSAYKGIYRVIHTSGSSGTIGLFVYGPHEWMIGKSLGLRVTGVNISPFRCKLAFIGATDGHYATITSVRDAPRLLFKILPLSICNPLEQICREIDVFQPDAVTGYASGISLLAREQLLGHINIVPKNIWCTGDPLAHTIRNRIRKAFCVNPVNLYGASETPSFAVECNSHHRMHLFNDWFSVQVVDNDHKCVRPGQPGTVIITSLYNYTQPLVRYQLNDNIVLSDKLCQCGWPFPVIEKITGRCEETLWFTRANGSTEFIHPSVLGEFFVSGLEKFQFVQTGPDRLTMKAAIQGEKNRVISAIKERMAEILSQKALDDTVQFEVELVYHIPNDPKTGKFRLVIPYSNKVEHF